MAPYCSPDTISVPTFPGGHILAFNVNLVENFTRTAPSQLHYGHPTITVENATFCNATVTYTHPKANDTIHVETWLPVDNYNGRLQAIGGGGWVAGREAPAYSAMTGALGEGYATSTTDAGLLQQADFQPDRWALIGEGVPNYHSLEDFASTSLNDQALIAKSLIESFYGQLPEYAYFSGCSQGGRQGMMLAQRYPEAYDGIHSCAPAIYWNEFFSYTFWPQMVMKLIDYYPYPCELNALVDTAIEACDGLDGVLDGIISDDSACDFDPDSVLGSSFYCPDTNTTRTISEEAAVIAKATWSGPRRSDGKFIWYGSNVGSQLSGSTKELTNDIGPAMTSCTGNGTCVGVPVGLGEVWIKYFIKASADWDYTAMTYEEFGKYVEESVAKYDSVIGTSDPDLTAFYENGGKILGYHGMSDQLIPIKGTEYYLDRVVEILPEVDDFYRMFEVPGLLHCSGGPGGQPTNTFDALRAWVENGTAPDSIPHSYMPDEEGPELQRLLCPYPKKAILKDCGRRSKKKIYRAEDYMCV